ncbi:hypothetical protein LEMLEM_LOCUS7598 [Lemmus lemmus]
MEKYSRLRFSSCCHDQNSTIHKHLKGERVYFRSRFKSYAREVKGAAAGSSWEQLGAAGSSWEQLSP